MDKFTKDIIKSISNDTIKWRHVAGLACVHTFFNNYYINLCAYKVNNKPVISLNVDNVFENVNDIVDVVFESSTEEYNNLYSIYNKAKKEGIQIPSGSLS